MRIETHGQQLEITPALSDYVENKFARLERHFEHRFDVRVQLGIDQPHHHAEATINWSGRSLHADADGQDMYAAIDLLVDKIDRQLLKQKERLVDHHRGDDPARSGLFN